MQNMISSGIQRIAILLISSLFFLSANVDAQCPTSVGCNNGGFILFYGTLPSPLPSEVKIIHNGNTYTHSIDNSNIAEGELFFQIHF